MAGLIVVSQEYMYLERVVATLRLRYRTLRTITHDYGDRPAGAAQKQPDWLLRVISRNYKNVLLAKNQKYLNEIYLTYVTVGG